MNDVIAFDSHRFVKNLTACGFTEQQAEALADEQVRMLDGNLATKRDLEKVKAELQADLEKVKAELQADIEKFKAELQAVIHKVDANLHIEIHKVKAEIHTIDANIRTEIHKIEARLLKWMVGAVIAQTGVISGLIVGLVRFS